MTTASLNPSLPRPRTWILIDEHDHRQQHRTRHGHHSNAECNIPRLVEIVIDVYEQRITSTHRDTHNLQRHLLNMDN
jgi:hypothetical protein